MRIISKFHDYYDGVQRIGYDAHVTYVREKKAVGPFDWPIPKNATGAYARTNRRRVALILIGFCGKFYPCLKCTVNYCEQNEQTSYCYSNDEVIELCGGDLNLSLWLDHFGSAELFKLSRTQLKLDQFIKYKSPILIYDERLRGIAAYDIYSSSFTNGSLVQYDFARILDPYTAFQEIEMFLGNIAQEIKPIPPMSDDDMRDIKGFDKWSFRKEPTKKK